MLSLVLAPFFVAAALQGPAVAPRPWPHEASDVQVNPRMHFGSLDNGMRLAWMANPEPKKRCYLRLHIDVGSLGEEDDELGMAHFVEHMAFNGSRSFPSGELVKWFQNHGMAFGADINAHTGHSETVYMLDLPNADADTVREGLHVFRDYADGVLFEQAEVDAEKGVIDGEEREADSPGRRIALESGELVYAGTRLPRRDIIGTKSARDAFTTEKLLAFYRRWYRPENATLMLVGDIGDLDPAPLMDAAFADWRGSEGEVAREPSIGTPTLEHRYYAIYEADLPYYVIGVQRAGPVPQNPLTKARFVGEVPLMCARAMFNLRLAELAKKKDAHFLQALVQDVNPLDDPNQVFDGDELSIVSSPEAWREALQQCEQELRRAVLFGFQEAELNEVRSDVLRSFDEAVKRTATRSSASLVAELESAAEYRSIPTEAVTDREMLGPAFHSVSLEECQRAFVTAWEAGALVIGGAGDVDLGENGADQLREAWEESREVELEAPAALELGTWAYPSAAESGTVTKQSRVEDLAIEQIDFENGVHVAIKPTDFKKGQILVFASLGEGGLTLEPSRAALGMVAGQVFDTCGLGAHSADDLRRLTAGKQVDFRFNVSGGAFDLGGTTTPEDLALQCELICAYLNDPGWREEGLDQFKKAVPEMYAGLEHEASGPLQLRFLPDLYSGDARFGMPERASVDAVDLGMLREWLTPELKEAPLDVCIVGDVAVEDAAQIVAHTFGLLPKRRAAHDHAERRKIAGPRTGLEASYEIDTDTDRATVMLVFPTTDGRNAATRVALDLLASIIGDRIRIGVRETLGASYSPFAWSQTSTVYPGDGVISLYADCDPEKVEALLAACFSVTDALAKSGVSAEELERAREPKLNELRDALRTNGFWMEAILEAAHSRPDALDEARNTLDLYRAVKEEEVTALAKQYLQRERVSQAVVSPEKQ